jgi:chemotaxis protein methyltransferase CheR
VAETLGHQTISDLLTAARAGHRLAQDQVVEAMTINETSFFRDSHPFRALAEQILPELLTPGERSLRMWSAAASTGQEAYSLAILMAEEFPRVPSPTILGTDVAASVLEKARSGVYSQLEVNRGLPARSLVRQFQQEGRNWRIKDNIAAMVRFQQLNLSLPWPSLPLMDVIMLRNVLLYFDEDTRTTVIARAARTLRPGGYLILGSAETVMVRSPDLERRVIGQTVCFRARG